MLLVVPAVICVTDSPEKSSLSYQATKVFPVFVGLPSEIVALLIENVFGLSG